MLGAAICLLAGGPVPGDVAITRALQGLMGADPQWAIGLTDTAKPPLLAATMIAAVGLAALAGGWRGAPAVPLAFALGWLADKALRAMIFAPRPSGDLVAVAHANPSSGLPSTFGMVYASLFGVVLFLQANGRLALAAKGLAAALIIAGCAARITLGGHWSSQMAASVMLGLSAALVATAAVERGGQRAVRG